MLPTLRKIFKSPTPSASDLDREMARFDERLAKARAALAGADASRGECWIEGEAAVEKNRAAIAKLTEEIADMEAARPLLLARLDERREAEAEARRRVAHEHAVKIANESAELIASRFPAIRREFLEFIRDIEVRKQVILEANADLPAGVAPINLPEFVARGRPALSEKVLKETTRIRWYARAEFGGGEISTKVTEFNDRGDGTATFKMRPGGSGPAITAEAFAVEETTRTVLPWRGGESADPFHKIRIPGYRWNDPCFEIDGFDRSSASVIEQIDAALAHISVPDRDDREPVTSRTDKVLAPPFNPLSNGYGLPRQAGAAWPDPAVLVKTNDEVITQ